MIAIAFSLTAFAQSVKIYEIEGGQKREVLQRFSIVDINSELEIKLNVDSLSLAISGENNSHPELQKKLDFYTRILKDQVEIQTLINTEFNEASTEAEKAKVLGTFSDKVDDMYDLVAQEDGMKAKFNDYIATFRKLPEAEKAKWQNYHIAWSMQQLNVEMEKEFAVLKNDIAKEKVQIQLYAYLHTKKENYKRVHIDNFDDYEGGEFHEVPRFASSFSEDDLAALQRNQKMADQLNVLVKDNFKNFSEVLKTNIESYDCILAMSADLKNLIEKRDDLFEENKEDIEEILDEFKPELDAALLVLKNMKDFDTRNLVESFSLLQIDFKVVLDSFLVRVEKSKDKLTKLSEIPEIKSFVKNLEECKPKIESDLARVNQIIEVTMNVLKPGAGAVEVSEKIVGDAFQFTINNLPETGYINLKAAGRRDDNDKIEIQLKIIRDNVNPKPIILEKRYLTMIQVKIHSVSNVSLILAQPYFYSSDVVKLDNPFQFAPAGNLLFKKGSRENKTWNFINPGFGFSMSTPDFDLDGVPEVGVGAVVTALNDVISLGISYNTKTDNPYWFFGLSLPFDMMGLPVNTIQTESDMK